MTVASSLASFVLPSAAPLAAPLALLVDGENVAKSHAGEVMAAASLCGNPIIRRVYGNAAHISGWEEQGFRLCPTRPGKNSADMLLCIEAMMLALRDGIETIVIATSDRDFSYLAEQLRETGIQVIGLGTDKTAASFRKTCSAFHTLSTQIAKVTEAAQPAKPPQAPRPELTKLIPLVRNALSNATSEGGWCTAQWIGVGLKRADPDFNVTAWGTDSLETMLLRLRCFETNKSEKGKTVFRMLQPVKAPAPHSAP